MPLRGEPVIVVTGLPRSGTSMLMQMLAAGGVPILSDGARQADEDNPHGYFEFEPVKQLLKNSQWLFEARGKAVKIVAPLIGALPRGLACCGGVPIPNSWSSNTGRRLQIRSAPPGG